VELALRELFTFAASGSANAELKALAHKIL
jgi:hypothetical protein